MDGRDGQMESGVTTYCNIPVLTAISLTKKLTCCFTTTFTAAMSASVIEALDLPWWAYRKPILTWEPVKGSKGNSADPDQMPHNVASDQGLLCSLTGFSSKIE